MSIPWGAGGLDDQEAVGTWRWLDVDGEPARVWVPERPQEWTPQRLREVAFWAAGWLGGMTSSADTRRTYLADIGLPGELARLGSEGLQIAAEVESATGMRLPVRAPSASNTTWHLALLPWLRRRGIDPWGPLVCQVMPQWGAELVGHGRVPDHVWEGDAQRVRPLSDALVRRRAASVRSYYRWHHAMGLTACSPADIWSPRAAGVPAAPAFREGDELDRDDLARLQVAADHHPGVPGDRELCSALVAVLVCTAARAVEVSRLNAGDYLRSYRRGPRLRLDGKGRRERTVPLDADTVARIDRWLEWRPDLAPFGRTAEERLATASRMPHPVPLFVPIGRRRRSPVQTVRASQEGHVGRLSAASVCAALRRVTARSTDRLVRLMADESHPHAIRAAVATALLDEGHQLHEVAALLGHSSLTTTARYDRQQRDRHLPAWLAGSGRQAAALEQARRAALTRDHPRMRGADS